VSNLAPCFVIRRGGRARRRQIWPIAHSLPTLDSLFHAIRFRQHCRCVGAFRAWPGAAFQWDCFHSCKISTIRAGSRRLDAAHDRAGSWPSSQRRSGRGRWPARPGHIERTAARRTRSGRGIGRATRAAMPASCAGGRGARPGRVLAILSAAVPVVADCGRDAASPSRAASRRTRPGRGRGRATRATMPASCAGGRAHDRACSWPSSQRRSGRGRLRMRRGLAKPGRIEAHTPRAPAWPRSSRRIAGVVRWWTWRTTGPGRGQLLSAVPVVADGRRGLGTSSRAASRGARAPGAKLAGQLAPDCRRRALVDVAHDRAGSWPSSQRRSGRGRWPARPGHIESGRIEGGKCSGRGTGRATRAARPASCAGGRGARPG
jgi:hypothetical protein